MDWKKVKYILFYLSGGAVMPPAPLLLFAFTPLLAPGLTEPPASPGARREAGAS